MRDSPEVSIELTDRMVRGVVGYLYPSFLQPSFFNLLSATSVTDEKHSFSYYPWGYNWLLAVSVSRRST